MLEGYFKRFGFGGRRIEGPPDSRLGMVVVIPCHDEPDLATALDALARCDLPQCGVEVCVVINDSEDSPAAAREQNDRTIAEFHAWAGRHNPAIRFGLIEARHLPARQAGVGLARKIGMDEAARRLSAAGNFENGLIVCFDADCSCDSNYLAALETAFLQSPGAPGCSIHFEHPLEGPLDPRFYRSIAEYELHLRYYVQALRYTGYPYAFHTVGSSMAVRAPAYIRQGGMNKRQAGEDFYFLHKVIPLGGFIDVTSTVVRPSPRASHRVPFGTGKAVGSMLRGERMESYPFEAFDDLAPWHGQIRGAPAAIQPHALSAALQDYLDRERLAEKLEEIREHTSSESAFRRRLWHWWNGFRVMKFIHHARDHFYQPRALVPEVEKLAGRIGVEGPCGSVPMSEWPRRWLEIFRGLDRRQFWFKRLPD